MEASVPPKRRSTLNGLHAVVSDLAVPDFFLWGLLKDRVFRRRIMTIQELKQAIVDRVAAIDEDLRRHVYGNFLPETLTRMH
jgi:hypothetical protein